MRKGTGVSFSPSRLVSTNRETHLKDKLLINVSFRNVRVEVGALDESEEELVDDLQVRPCEFEHWFVLLGIVGVACWVDGWWDRPEEVGSELSVYDVSYAARTSENELNEPWRRLQGRRSR
jgi:hypothetical protein